jgi:superfamily II DNA helicase RecQ
MPYAFFRIPAAPEPGAVESLNAFMRSHSVLAVQREWVSAADASFWAFCVQYQEAAAASAKAAGGGAKVDYKELLTDEQFQKFAKLRNLRKELADKEGVPVFAVFTNEQLAEIVKTNANDKTKLKAIAGIGEARVEKYGEAVLAVVNG